GISDGTNPQNPVTREQIVTILWRYAGKPAGEGSLSSFPDARSVSEWALEAFEWAVDAGIINGSGGKLVPQGLATRAELAAILHRFAMLDE
ncbi:MAG: S-layer homology domain-containing protein, partial [Clostridiales bacterium]|nr:S-layer homology domain-containing protein [Clostridiales bacterium]